MIKRKRGLQKNIKKELEILKKMGLEEYEIEYLIFLKTKELAKTKWHHKLKPEIV